MKIFKRILTIGLALCTLFSLIALTACGDDTTDKKTTYTVTVTCENPLTLNGVKVQLKAADGTVAGESNLSNGVANIELDAGTYTVVLAERLSGVLADYTYDSKTVTAENPSVTVALVSKMENAEKIDYTVTATLPDGTPVADITVQLCGGPVYVCNTATTNSSGVAVFNVPAGDYEVHIEEIEWPDGYTFDDNKYKMDENGGSITVKFDVAA